MLFFGTCSPCTLNRNGIVTNLIQVWFFIWFLCHGAGATGFTVSPITFSRNETLASGSRFSMESTFNGSFGVKKVRKFLWLLGNQKLAFFHVKVLSESAEVNPAPFENITESRIIPLDSGASQMTVSFDKVPRNISESLVRITDPRNYTIVYLQTHLPMIKDCSDPPDYQQQFLHADHQLSYAFKDKVTYRCQNGSKLYVDNKPVGVSYFLECQQNAEWSKLYNISCYRAPVAALSITPNPLDFEYNETTVVNVTCATHGGYPSGNALLRIRRKNSECENDLQLQSPYSITYKDHLAVIICFASNEFDNSTVNETLKVLSLPSVRNHSCEEAIENGKTNISVIVFGYPNLTGDNIVLNVSDSRHAEGISVFEHGVLTYRLTIPKQLFGNIPAFFEVDVIDPAGKHRESLPFTLTCRSHETTPNPTTEGAIAGIAAGGCLILILSVILILLIVRRRKSAKLAGDSNVNAAFTGSQGVPEREDRENVLYVTGDDLKSGGNSGEMVNNVLYGSTPAPRDTGDLYSTVDKTSNKKKATTGSDQAAELYTTVQKTKKTKEKAKVVDPGASTSGLQSDDTYAEVNKDKKKKKDGKKAGKGQENSGFASDAQQDATYAVVDKKKNKGAKAKKADEPGTSGLVEEATYAVVNKKDKKPKKDGPDDDLHGSNKA